MKRITARPPAQKPSARHSAWAGRINEMGILSMIATLPLLWLPMVVVLSVVGPDEPVARYTACGAPIGYVIWLTGGLFEPNAPRLPASKRKQLKFRDRITVPATMMVLGLILTLLVPTLVCVVFLLGRVIN